MKREEIKNSIENIKPDFYMEKRLYEKISDAAPKKRSKKKFLIAAVSCTLSLAVLAAGLGIAALSKNNTGNDQNADGRNSVGNRFIMSVSAEEVSVPLENASVTFPVGRLEVSSDEYGIPEVNYSAENVLSVSGNNIASVTYRSKFNNFMVRDFDKFHDLVKNNSYYDIIVPYSDEYEGKGNDKRLDIMMEHIKNGDYDVYLKNAEKKSKDEYAGVDYIDYGEIKEYGIELDFNIDVNNLDDYTVVAMGLASTENYNRISSSEPVQEYTFENYFNKESEIGLINWFCLENSNALLENPEMPLSQLPHDTVTVEVKFNDGTTQTQKYDFSFNDKGNLVIDRL